MKKQMQVEQTKLLHTIQKFLEGPMIFLGFVWLLLLVVELVWGLTPVLEWMSISIWIIFIIDFILKFILARTKLHFFKKNWLTALSLLIPAIRIFRVLRVFRLFRGVRLIKLVASLNRSIRSLAATMSRRAFGYVFLLILIVTFGGAAGMYAIERGNTGFENYGMALWWTAMRIITAGSDFWPATAEGRTLAFIIALFGYGIFGYITATLASFFIGRDAEEKNAPVLGKNDIEELKETIAALAGKIEKLNTHKN